MSDVPAPNGQRDTLVSLRDYLDSEIEHERELREAQQASHGREHVLAERALELAATLAAQNKVDSNEWRATMSDRERAFLPRLEFATGHDGLSARLVVLERADIARSTREQERERQTLRNMALIGLLATIVSVAFSIVIKLSAP